MTNKYTPCPYCGLCGPNYDESEQPSDYCHHDLAEDAYQARLEYLVELFKDT